MAQPESLICVYKDTFVAPHEAGIHYGTLSAFFAHFQPGMLQINGLDPTKPENSEALTQIQQGDEVTIEARTGNEQTDRDAVHIAEGLITAGHDPWQMPGKKMNLPIERYNQAANYARQNWLSLPVEETAPMNVTSAVDDRFQIGDIIEGDTDDGRKQGTVIGEPPEDQPQGYYRIRWDDGTENVMTWGFLKLVERTRPDAPTSEAADTLWPNTFPEKWAYVESAASADVSSDMSVTSKWKVIALGEIQQPGGVGGTQEDYNPVVDGPNPEGPEIDNAANSPEQEVAMQTWVNTAVDMLNRGEDPQAVIAKLAHDGCPNPEEILQRAQQQPMEQPHPVSDSIGQDPFQAPPPADQTGEMQSLSQQPPTLASNANEVGGPIGQPADSAKSDTPGDLMKIDNLDDNSDQPDLFEVDGTPDTDNHVPEIEFKDEATKQETKDVHSKRVRIAGTTMTGRELDRWEGMWGEGTVKIALDNGGTINVDPSAVEPIDNGSFKHPVTEIQKFIDSMPQVEPSRPFIEARIANLELVRRAVRSTISKVSFSDQQKLARMDKEAEEEAALLKEALDNTVHEYEVEYFKHLPGYQINAFNVATPEVKEWEGRPREAGAIWASENFTATVDDESFMAAAAHHASNLGLTGTQFSEFLAGAEKNRTDKCPNCGASVTAHTGTYCHACGETLTKESATEAEDHEGPAEALFLS